MRAAGVRLYAVSYDDPEALADFASAHGIEFPLLADPRSEVIKAFGILNTLIPEDEAEFHGVPFPVSYVTDAEGVVAAKFAEANQIFRPGPELLLRAALGDAVEIRGARAAVADGEVGVRAYLDGPTLVPGLLRELVVEFIVPTGRHLYGEPVPTGLVATTVTIDAAEGMVVRETTSPPTSPHRLATGETLHVYDGHVELRTPVTVLGAHGRGNDGTESRFGVGEWLISGTARFQSCDDVSCDVPQAVRFEVPVTVEAPIIGDFAGEALRSEPMNGRRHMRRLLNRRDEQ